MARNRLVYNIFFKIICFSLIRKFVHKCANMLNIFCAILFIMLNIKQFVDGHGRLMDPPARNSMWRFGYPNPVNYNDNELFCGGYASIFKILFYRKQINVNNVVVQWEQNDGKCGLCGDPFHVKEPRPHEAGGLYAKGIISRHYSVGQEIDIEVELTANHYGRFEIFLCPNNNPNQGATQECFNRYPLYLSGSRNIAYEIPEDGKKKAVFRYVCIIFILSSRRVKQFLKKT